MRCFFVLLIILLSAIQTFARGPYDYYGYHSPYYNNYYAQERQFREPYYSRRYEQNYYENQNDSVLKKLKQHFIGQLTGFTPQVSPYSTQALPSTYGTQRVDSYSSPWGSGYRVNNYDTGSSSSVRILD